MPWPDLAGAANVVVDAQATAGTVLTLSHHPGAELPAEVRADTSTAIVDRFLRLADGGRPDATNVVVSNDHYDEDGLFGLWLLIEQPPDDDPRRVLACDAAAAGDFGTWTRSEAAWCAITAMALAEGSTTPLPMVRRALARSDGRDPAGEIYREVLPRIGRVLDDPERFRDLWEPRWSRVDADLRRLRGGTPRLEEIPAADLAVLHGDDGSLDDLAVLSFTEMTRVLSIDGSGALRLRYRYETWVDYASRPLRPRAPLAPLAAILSTAHPDVDWKHDRERDPRPRLWSADGQGRPGAVADPAAAAEAIADYLSGDGA